ncbi:pentapeptide repeat-containing protein [Nostoc sp. DedSLP03]|uniref:pentapeptide repeat-containing protein n=1 Tax=Nostoc sp. DedSLP03 TaxID=3075400 RepID=UPI003A0FCF5C
MPQDFSHQNLRGRSFKGQDLAGANFSGADIRSTDFTGANLIGANFSHAKAGLEKRWGIYLPIALFLFVGLLGVFSYITHIPQVRSQNAVFLKHEYFSITNQSTRYRSLRHSGRDDR